MFHRVKVLMIIAMIVVGAEMASALNIGDKAPTFIAQGIDGKEYSLDSVSKRFDLVVLCFTCNRCPLAIAYEDRFIKFNKEYKEQSVAFIALNCNNKTEGLDVMKERAEEKGFNFVYAFDETGNVARAYSARVTPELFVIQDGKIAYHGAFDDDRDEPSSGHLVNAVDALLAGGTPDVVETRAFGCRIKN